MRADREHVTFQRPVMVELVPYGTPIEIGAGMTGHITQALGGNFTLVVDGQMVRLKGSDADAIGKDAADAQQHPEPEDDDGADLHTRIYRALATCYDPEIPVNIVELGLIYACEIEPLDDGRSLVRIQMTLTAPGCGMGDVLVQDVKEKVELIPTIASTDVELVFDPPWSQDMMSEAARLQTGMM